MRTEHKRVWNFHSKFTPQFWILISILTTGMRFSCLKLKITKNFNLKGYQKYNSAPSDAIKSSIHLISFESKPFQFWIQNKQKLPIQPIIIYNFDCFDFSWPVLLSNSFINSHATFLKTEYGVNLETLKNNRHLFRSHSLLSLGHSLKCENLLNFNCTT